MLINNQLTQAVLSAWIQDQQHPHRSRAQHPIPSEQDFGVLLDTMFRGSLLSEEGTNVITSVSWLSREDFDEHELKRARESRLLLEFSEPIPFEARNLAKLNGIVNGKTGSLLACQNESTPHIWGICYFMSGSGAIGEIPAGTMEVRHFRPDCPTVTITGIGAMQITRGDSVIGRIEGGQFLLAHATVFHSLMLGPFLYRLINIEIDPTSRQFKNAAEAEKARSFFNCLNYLIEVLSQRRTGATVIVIPPHQKDHALRNTETAWRVSGSLEIDLLQRARQDYQRRSQEGGSSSNQLFRLKIDQALRNRLRSLIDLAGIDGALLLTPSFDVIGFGMKLKSSKWSENIQHGPLIQATERQELEFSRLGTRHNSALNFVGSVDGSVAFVASSDGPIRALTKASENQIWYWPDCRVSMFA